MFNSYEKKRELLTNSNHPDLTQPAALRMRSLPYILIIYKRRSQPALAIVVVVVVD